MKISKARVNTAGLGYRVNSRATGDSFVGGLQEAGMIKSTPQKIIAQGTYWRFLNELKRELKA